MDTHMSFPDDSKFSSNFSSNLFDISSLKSSPSHNGTDDSWNMSDIVTTIFVPIIFGLIAILGLIGNSLVICTVVSDRRMRSNTFALITNLAVADLLFIVTCVPFTAVVYSQPGWPFGVFFCKIHNYGINVTAYVSAYTLILMAVDRFLAVVYPVRSKSIRTCRNTLILIVAMWILLCLFNIPVLLQHNVEIYEIGDEKRSMCINVYISWDRGEMWRGKIFYACFFVFAYFLPLSIISILYAVMLNHLPGMLPRKAYTTSTRVDTEKTFQESSKTTKPRLPEQKQPEDPQNPLQPEDPQKPFTTIIEMENQTMRPSASVNEVQNYNQPDTANNSSANMTGDSESFSESQLSGQVSSPSSSFANPSSKSLNKGVRYDRNQSTNHEQNHDFNQEANHDNNHGKNATKSSASKLPMHLQIDTSPLITVPSTPSSCLTPPTLSSSVSGQSRDRHGKSRREKANRRVTRLVIIVIAVFALCWLPWHVINIIQYWIYDGIINNALIHLMIRLAATCFAYTNSCVNPILYAFLSENFRQGLRRLFTHCRNRLRK